MLSVAYRRTISKLFIALNLIIRCEAAEYTAHFINTTSGGASGFFRMNILNGSASYNFQIDLSNFDTSCDISQGLKYHIHSYWKNNASDSAANEQCGKIYTGGHFDPYLACSSSSQDAMTLCKSLNRTASQGYQYNCSNEVFHQGYYGYCEVGDLSGKFGLAPRSSAKIFSSDSKEIDFLPPFDNNFNTNLAIFKPWTSIVFHCPQNDARLICAKFLPLGVFN